MGFLGTGTSFATLAAAYLGALTIFAIVDFLWLAIVAKTYYRDGIGHLMASPINIPAAIVFYLVFVLGLTVFAVVPALGPGGSWMAAARTGMLFGLFCYATYDLTNLATLKNWPLTLSLVDMAWGTTLSGITAAAGYTAARMVVGT